jgi:acyl-coenzyme A thioesterase PaaI-like protein
MPLLELPHAGACLVCGRHNPHGLRLSLYVNTDDNVVTCDFSPQPHHAGFEGIVHGGLLATVADEAMVWAATWTGRNFCVCGEMAIRYRARAQVGMPLTTVARVESARARLVMATCIIYGPDEVVVAQAMGKYVPMPPDQSRRILDSLLPDPSTAAAAALLRVR